MFFVFLFVLVAWVGGLCFWSSGSSYRFYIWLLMVLCIRLFSEFHGGTFVHVGCASPCPGFNRGKIAPGGGRGSRGPPDMAYPFLPVVLE